MKPHTKAYLDHFGYKSLNFEDLFIACENCGARAVDVHHLSPRGSGGSKNKDYIENLIGLCRNCHARAEAHLIAREDLQQKHLKNI